MKTAKVSFQPHISTKKKVREFSFKAIILGILLGFLFAIGNAYLGLKTGTTISASIPAAILSMTILRVFFKKATILENNIVQTIATVGEGMAAGVIFTIPALFFLESYPSILKIFVLSLLGGILGILFMIPMRRYVIVEEHNKLPFPEGTACAEILKAGEKKNHVAAIDALWGFAVGVVYKVCTSIFYIWEEIPTWVIKPFKRTEFSIDTTPALLGVGYIIGPRISSIMFVGGMFSWWVIIPLIRIFSSHDVIIFPSTTPIDTMSTQDIWSNYVRYIGAGAVAIGGLFNLIKIIPVLTKSIHQGVKELFIRYKSSKKIERVNKDISLLWVILGSLAIILLLWLLPITSMNFFTILLLVILGFFFVCVTSITVGIVGSTSNPGSGMTLTTLLITCIIFAGLGWTDFVFIIAAMTMSCVANVAITMAATTSQDLKTGFLLGATPRSQQIAEIIGTIIPAITLAITVYVLNKAYTLGSVKMPAPQATLMAMIAKGIISGNLPYLLVVTGAVLGGLVAILRLPILAFAMGLYLPLSLSSAIMVGGVASWYVHRKKKNSDDRGILISSGLIAGDALTGILIALLTITHVLVEKKVLFPSFASIILFALLAIFLSGLSLYSKRNNYLTK